VAIDVNSRQNARSQRRGNDGVQDRHGGGGGNPRQLSLANLGGVIICDFIDLRYERHRRELFDKLADKFKHDRAKTKVLPMSQSRHRRDHP